MKSKLFDQIQPNQNLYKYQLSQRIGAGSFGQVWLARDLALNQQYAIKILPPGASVHDRLKEAQIGHTFVHNNVVRVHQADVTEIDGDAFVIIAMDYMPEGSITRLVNPSNYLKLPDVIRISKDILRGLEYLHQYDIYHNDVKPDNVLIGSQGQAMITDYGIVGVAHNGSPVTASQFYKLHGAPEVLSDGSITAQTDLFQTGLTMFRLALGLGVLRDKWMQMGEVAYFEAVAAGTLIKDSDFAAWIPARLRRIIRKAVQPCLESRYRTALEMLRDLEKLNYPGYWTVESDGSFVGHKGPYTYRFESTQKSGQKHDIVAFRCNDKTMRENKIGAHCHFNLSKASAKKAIERFIGAVVEGK